MSKNKKRPSGDIRRKAAEKQDRDKSVAAVTASPKEGGASSKGEKKPVAGFASFRELIESVAIAFILAFLFRTFEAEAFIIPTGSMATTLRGRHKDVTCPKCGYPYPVSSSEEVDSISGEVSHPGRVYSATCPMCGYGQLVNQEPSYNGDRILVSKFDYQLHKPQRWDVTVFMYPEDAKINFIKRLVGLPNETVKISHGDLLVKKKGESSYAIARKAPKKYLAMSRVVHDNDYSLPQTLIDKGWPQRWQSPGATATWEASDDYRSFSTDGSKNKDVVLRYYHYLPDNDAWNTKAFNQSIRRSKPEKILPQLITDSCSYNSGESQQSDGVNGGVGFHWVGDLGVECQLEVRKPSGEIVFELIEGGRKMLCSIDLSDGTANLTIPGEPFLATGKTPISGPGSYAVRFVNADDELRLWVDDNVVAFDKPTTFGPLDNQVPTAADLSPVAIHSMKADVTVSHLRILRDIYYIATKSPPLIDFKNQTSAFNGPGNLGFPSLEARVRHFYQTPKLWPRAFAKNMMQEVEFPLEDKQYFMMGDNSPQSKDGRLWDKQYYVDERLLKGKAMFIYWPHSWDKVKIGDIEIPFPFFPNYERMHAVR